MATINSRKMVDEIIANNGHCKGDLQVVRIVQYNNIFDGRLAYGLIYRGEDLQRYHEGAGINPTTIFDAKEV